MRESLVGLGHTMHLFLTLDSGASVVAGVDDLAAHEDAGDGFQLHGLRGDFAYCDTARGDDRFVDGAEALGGYLEVGQC